MNRHGTCHRCEEAPAVSAEGLCGDCLWQLHCDMQDQRERMEIELGCLEILVDEWRAA